MIDSNSNFGISLSAKQLEFKQKIIDDPTVVEALIGGSAGGGKTMSMCIAIIMSIATYPGLQVALGRKTLQGLSRSTVSTLLGKVHPMFHIGPDDFRYDKKEGTISYHDGSKITLMALDYEPSDPDFARLGSAEFDWAFVDEAGEIGKQAKDVLRSRLGRGIATQKFGIPPKIILSCIPKGGKVLTTEGYKLVEDITQDDVLISGDGTPTHITRVFQREAKEPLYTIKVHNLLDPLQVTGEHPILVSNGVREKRTWYKNGKQVQHYLVNHNYQYTPTKDVRAGQWLRFPRQLDTLPYPEWPTREYTEVYKKQLSRNGIQPTFRRYTTSPLDNPLFWWFVGYWLGDGWITDGNIYLCCDNKNPKIIERIEQVISLLDRKPSYMHRSGCTTMVFRHEQLCEFLAPFGRGAGGKTIPEWALRGKHSTSLIGGFLDADGSTPRSKGMEFVSINQSLLTQVQRQLFNLGIIGCMKHRAVEGKVMLCGRLVHQKDRYHLSYGQYDTALAMKCIDSIKLSQLDFTAPKARRRTYSYCDDKYVYLRVSEVSKAEFEGSVYNFETTTHNYIAEGVDVHNCNPSTNFLRTEYYQPYTELGAGGFQKWPIGEVIVQGVRTPAYRAFLRMSVKDNSFIDRNYYETLKQLPERERKRLLDGNWDYADNDRMLFTGELIDDCTIRAKPEMSVVERNDYLMGVDVADVGTDASVISVIQNNILIKQIKINLRDAGIGKDSKVDIGDFLSDRIIHQAKLLGLTERDAARITIETNGVGSSLRDALRRKKWYVTEYTADTNSRGRMFYSLHQLMVDGKVFIYDNPDINYSELRRQMNAHEYELEADKVRITRKKDLRRQLGCSPDMADSFAIALYPRGDAMIPLEQKKINYFTKLRL